MTGGGLRGVGFRRARPGVEVRVDGGKAKGAMRVQAQALMATGGEIVRAANFIILFFFWCKNIQFC